MVLADPAFGVGRTGEGYLQAIKDSHSKGAGIRVKSRSHLTLFALVAAVAAWPVAALAGNPHGAPPGQEKKTHGAAGTHVKVHAQAHGNAHVRTGVTATAHGHAKVKAGADVTGRAHAYANSNAAVNAHAKVHGRAAVGVGVGVKSSSTTAKNTFAAAASTQTKLYGNGRTAGEIAMMFGAQADLMLFGPGNSQPHKVSCGAHWIDVHALKARAGACAGGNGSAHMGGAVHAGVSGRAGVSGQLKVYGNGQTAAEIAAEAGFPGAVLVAAGNSGLHKVSCGGHMIDVHALKAHACSGTGEAGARGKASGGVSAGTSGQVSASASGNVHGSTGAQGRSGTGAGGAGVLGASSTRQNGRSSVGSGVLGAASRTGTLPFTGAPLWIAALLAAALVFTGLGLRRAGRTRA